MASFTFAQLEPRAGTASGLPYGCRAASYMIERTVDFSKSTPAGVALALTAGQTGDVIHIPAKCIVLTAGYEIITPEADAQTFSLGDSAAAAQFLANTQNAAAAAGTIMVAPASTMKVYTAANALRVTAATGTAMNTAVIRFFAVIIDLK